MEQDPPEGVGVYQPYRAPKLALSLADFELIRKLGDGSFAQVVEVRHKATGRVYALKAVDKHLVLRHKQANYIRAERALLDRLAHPGIVRLRFTFQDAASLYLGLDLCPNGELYDQIQRKERLTLEEARFYASEIVDVLAYLREQQVVHRDLKPENLLLTADGHLRLSDFGSAKDLAEEQPAPCHDGAARGKDLHAGRRSSSLVGSADYVSPETLRNEPVGPEADLWALGCIIYQMLVGKAPFRAASEYLTFERIASGKMRVPSNVAAAAADVIKRLLRAEPAKRLGAGKRGMEELKGHAFFRGVDWQHVREQQPPALAPPPPPQPGDEDAEGLNWEMTSMLSALPLQYSYSDSAPDLHPTQGPACPAMAPPPALAEPGQPTSESAPRHSDGCGGASQGVLLSAAAADGRPALQGGCTATSPARSLEAAPVDAREQTQGCGAEEPKRGSKDAGTARIAAYSHGTMVESRTQPAMAV